MDVYGWVVCILFSPLKQIVYWIRNQLWTVQEDSPGSLTFTDVPVGGVLSLGSFCCLPLI